MEKALRVAYVVVMFPCYSETFVLREILELTRRGALVTILSLRGFSENIMDDDAHSLLPRTLYSPYILSLKLLSSNLYFLLRKPRAYMGIIALFLSRLILNPRELVKNAALFPKSVHFARLLKERGVTHVHAHFTNYPASAAYIISRLTGIPFSMTAHAHDIFQSRLLLRDKLALAQRLFAISDYNRRFIIEKCRGISPEKIEVLHCGLDLSRMPSATVQPAGGCPLILSAGRMVAIKGFDTLVRALSVLRERGCRFRCTIIGDGPERPKIGELIERLSLGDVVDLAGERKSQDVLALMKSCRVFVLASRLADRKSGVMDGIPVSLMEAMAIGIPVVSCPVSGIPELVVEGETGLLAPPDNERGLAEAILRLLTDEELRRQLAAGGREKVEREFNVRRNVGRLLEVFARRASTD